MNTELTAEQKTLVRKLIYCQMQILNGGITETRKKRIEKTLIKLGFDLVSETDLYYI